VIPTAAAGPGFLPHRPPRAPRQVFQRVPFFRRNGGYSYSNAGSASRPAGSSYYAPSASAAASGAGFFTAKGGASGGGYSYYQNASGARSYK